MRLTVRLFSIEFARVVRRGRERVESMKPVQLDLSEFTRRRRHHHHRRRLHPPRLRRHLHHRRHLHLP